MDDCDKYLNQLAASLLASGACVRYELTRIRHAIYGPRAAIRVWTRIAGLTAEVLALERGILYSEGDVENSDGEVYDPIDEGSEDSTYCPDYVLRASPGIRALVSENYQWEFGETYDAWDTAELVQKVSTRVADIEALLAANAKPAKPAQ